MVSPSGSRRGLPVLREEKQHGARRSSNHPDGFKRIRESEIPNALFALHWCRDRSRWELIINHLTSRGCREWFLASAELLVAYPVETSEHTSLITSGFYTHADLGYREHVLEPFPDRIGEAIDGPVFRVKAPSGYELKFNPDQLRVAAPPETLYYNRILQSFVSAGSFSISPIRAEKIIEGVGMVTNSAIVGTW